jgi:flagellar motor protein MotB
MAAHTDTRSTTAKPDGRPRGEVRGRGEDFACQIALAKAAELAMEGRPGESETIAVQILKRNEGSVAALDLLARIRCQQGRYSEAALFWKRASEIEPANSSVKEALIRLEKIHQFPFFYSGRSPILFAAAILLITVSFGGFIALRHFLTKQVVSPVNETSSLALRHNEGVSQPRAFNLDLSGTATRTEGKETVIVFDSGLFQNGVVFKRSARTLLKEVGQQLGPVADDLSVLVIGHTDDSPLRNGSLYRDNQSLGLLRAVTVAEFLRTETPMKTSVFAVESLGEKSPLFPNGNRNERLKNQTVELRISRVQR